MAEYIEREALKAEFEEDGHLSAYVEEMIDSIHNADVRPVMRGKWDDYQQGRWVYAKCSECETVHDVRSNFCPNCGADMRGES